MAYSELIKSFEKIRDYMRDFYVYGFKSREDYTKKSARSYDDERRRIESWLGGYMAFRHTAEGKNVFISVDNRSVTLFEWFSSPIVYRETAFADEFRSVMLKYFSSKRGLSHYLSMAGGNYREYLKGDMVKAKKYFYVLRPILACRWILDKGTPPPMLFSELVEAELDPALLPDVDRLLELRMNAPEIKTIPKIESINRYLDSSIEELRSRIVPLPEDTNHGWEDLNRLFLSQLR